MIDLNVRPQKYCYKTTDEYNCPVFIFSDERIYNKGYKMLVAPLCVFKHTSPYDVELLLVDTHDSKTGVKMKTIWYP